MRSATAAAAHPDVGPFHYVTLLGLRTVELRDLVRAVERGLPFSAIERLHRHVGLDVEQIAELVQIPRRTLTRRRQEGRFQADESDRLVRATRLLAKALELFEGNIDAAKGWLSAPQTALGGAIPLHVAKTEVGAREVETLIDRLEQGVFA